MTTIAAPRQSHVTADASAMLNRNLLHVVRYPGLSMFTILGPAGLQRLAQYQPFTPFIETVRGLLLGTPLGWNVALAVGWAVALTVVGYVWSMVIYERKSVR